MNVKKTVFAPLLDEIREMVRASGSERKREVMEGICKLLTENVSYYDWVGFYLVDPDAERELILGPYVGDGTDHTRILFGKGICGQAAEMEDTFLVQDVTEQDNYLSCSINVRSEIVVPIIFNGKVEGEIDIDSHTVAPFSDEDKLFLEEVTSLVAPLLSTRAQNAS